MTLINVTCEQTTTPAIFSVSSQDCIDLAECPSGCVLLVGCDTAAFENGFHNFTLNNTNPVEFIVNCGSEKIRIIHIEPVGSSRG